MQEDKLMVIGAGLCGVLLAIRLAQRGYQVEVYERRPDMRTSKLSAGRSINLALSDRGLKALALVGMADQIKAGVIPMHGRMIHPVVGEARLSRYSGREDEYINSVGRGGLNIALLDEAEKHPNLSLHFETACQQVDFRTGMVQLKDMRSGKIRDAQARVVFGADGAGSALRSSMVKAGAHLRFNYEQRFLEHGYKELSIPPTAEGGYRIEPHALHIWPRGGFMMIALPNLDGSFTVTLFLPFEGELGFEYLNNEAMVRRYFETHFPDALPLIPNLTETFQQNPTSSLGMVRCYPWQVNGRFLLIGDSAHAIVPFYGQGMNCAFEDVSVLDAMIDQYAGNWEKILPAYQESRKPDTDAIYELAVDNFYEMRDHVADPIFVKKRQLEMQLEQQFPDYFSKYSLVTFREDLGYAEALQKGRAQDAALMEICAEIDDPTAVDLEILRQKVREKVSDRLGDVSHFSS